ncbi:MAG: orotate phosphoribosyltransferase [Gammaproteobacteria bacterium]|nr:orotate phosphoribosyltransferase [Gammaproteobacteria bacterium]
MDSNANQFIQFALEREALKFGSFELKSGRVSPYFFNAGVFNDSEALWQLGRFYAQAIVQADIKFDVLFGPAYKGIPLVCTTAICLLREFNINKPFSFNRKEVKSHGEGGWFVGAPLEGRVLIVDDVISSGATAREVIPLIREISAQPVGLVISFDRQEKGEGEASSVDEMGKEFGVPVISVANVTQLAETVAGDARYSGFIEGLREYQGQYGAVAGTK